MPKGHSNGGPKRQTLQPGDPGYRSERHGGSTAADLYGGFPAEPAELSLDDDPVAHAMWRRALEQIPNEVLVAVDAPQLALMCRWWSQLNQILDEYSKNPTDASLARQAKTAHDAFCGIANLFGLSPAKRKAIRVSPAAEDKTDRMAEMLGLTDDK